MSKQPWRVKFEQWQAAHGDGGLSGVADHLELLIRVANLLRVSEFKSALEKFLGEWGRFVRRLYESESISIAACDGSRFISQQNSLFLRFIDGHFSRLGLDVFDKATEKTEVAIYELFKDATYEQMFNSLSLDRESLCLTQDQIIDFCEHNRDELRKDGYCTFFLFKKDDPSHEEKARFFVASVSVTPDGLGVYVYSFKDSGMQSSAQAHRLVVPQLKL